MRIQQIAVEGAIVQGRNMFQVMQAVVLICIGSFMSARFVLPPGCWVFFTSADVGGGLDSLM